MKTFCPTETPASFAISGAVLCFWPLMAMSVTAKRALPTMWRRAAQAPAIWAHMPTPALGERFDAWFDGSLRLDAPAGACFSSAGELRS